MLDNLWDILSLKGAGRKIVDTASTFGVPLKSLGYNGSNKLCERSVASKLSVHETNEFLYRKDKEIDEKVKFS